MKTSASANAQPPIVLCNLRNGFAVEATGIEGPTALGEHLLCNEKAKR
jgi:hypothetical protein